MHRTIFRVFGAALMLAFCGTVAAQDQPAPSSSAHTTFGGWLHAVGAHAAQVGKQIVGGHGASNAGAPGAGGGPLYQPESGAGSFRGLFAAQSHDLAKQGRLQWPRAALTFETYGVHQDCWTVRATIWTNATTSTVETFQTCLDAPLTHTDDTGQATTTTRNVAFFSKLLNAQVMYGRTATTGEQRTTGPNPPRSLFNVDVPTDLYERVNQAVINAAWVSGFYGPSDEAYTSIFYDDRLWIAGFNPQGNRG
ncbi:MAG TPA: hypothetical protein VMB73_18240 [Acetobacteraceae bacterium]|nr:hypothetical protein [Acetobacteraceae bacterium]